MSAAIVATIRSPGAAPLRSWLRHHRALGFERLYLFFDAGDPGIAEARATPGVEVTVVDEAHFEALAQHPYAARHVPLLRATGLGRSSPDALTALQLCNMAMGLERARRDGMRWLLHIDVDELFHPGEGSASEHFALLDRLGLGQARYINHEAMPTAEEHADYFREMTLFKRNPAELPDATKARVAPFWAAREGYFLAYANGKCAVRTLPGVTPATAHGFQLPVVALGRANLSSPCVLHYPYVSFEQYWAKHARLGDYAGDALLGEDWTPPPFALASRDYVRDGRREDARRRYARTVLLCDPRERDELLAEGVLFREQGPAHRLAEGDAGGGLLHLGPS